ncbi:hypothetical protein [Mycobacterium asiaticum]|uniref:hypothetical protein n=1 Tax=Mycobacterium asiaticum TaxID=1790 RepID=UPI000ABEF2E3|nr:hypothetical protein [Mycobacterium asiaticum]
MRGSITCNHSDWPACLETTTNTIPVADPPSGVALDPVTGAVSVTGTGATR